MKQHFVPEFYLKNFTTNGKQLFIYDKVIHKSFTNSISSVASQESFYDNSDNQSIENEIGKLEGKTGIVIKNLIEALVSGQFSRINKEQKNVLIEFIWFQMNRTKESRIQFGSMRPHLFSKLANVPF